VERLFKVSVNNQPAYCDPTSLGTAFPWWKCPAEITIRAYSSVPRIVKEEV